MWACRSTRAQTRVSSTSGLEGPQAAAAARKAAAVFALADELEGQVEAHGMKSLYREIEMPLIVTLAHMESAGMAVDADQARGTVQGGRRSR